MRVSGLYAIPPQTADGDMLVRQVEAALAGGARAVQYRDKSEDHARRRAQAVALRELTRRYAALLIVNDDVDLAREVRADGVHLGRDDFDLPAARARLGSGMLIGASCYADLARALAAARAGADYVAFGSVFPSRTKPAAPRASLSLFAQAREHLRISLVAIGGITLANVREVVAAGADGVAVVSALFDAPDVRATAEAFSRIANQQRRGVEAAHENT
jgi:thiamine-phosphate pyrophosphorylase